MTEQPAFSDFAAGVTTETAFDVLAIARRLKAAGKTVIELEIGDSPFATTPAAAAAGIAAIEDDACHYGPSIGIPEFRSAVAVYVNDHYGLNVSAENVVAGPGAKIFEQLFCETFVNPGDGVLVFSPFFPTYPPNIARRGGRLVFSELKQEQEFRPHLDDVARFLEEDPQPKAIFLNSPHNPTGGVATEADLAGLADLVRGRNIAVFSDEPYDQMVWRGQHHSLLAQPGMLEQCVAAYTFSKSFSMSGWRLGYAVSSESTITMFAKLTNTTLSCVPPFVQRAGVAGLQQDCQERDSRMETFRHKVEYLATELNKLDGVRCLVPGGTFYVFPCVAELCNRLGITSHGLAMYLLEGADEQFGVACLGGNVLAMPARASCVLARQNRTN
ncbi:MAG: aminotransferase class I/II-fold pyridoxal phosphate-dependent enzyme [Pirellulaceae bacterium]